MRLVVGVGIALIYNEWINRQGIEYIDLLLVNWQLVFLIEELFEEDIILIVVVL